MHDFQSFKLLFVVTCVSFKVTQLNLCRHDDNNECGMCKHEGMIVIISVPNFKLLLVVRKFALVYNDSFFQG